MSETGIHGDITRLTAAVATLTTELVARKELMERIEGDQKEAIRAINEKLTRIDNTVSGEGGHSDWIKARKRDGWWLGSGLVGLGAILSAAFEWWKSLPPPN